MLRTTYQLDIGKDEYEIIKVNGRTLYICGTSRPYDDLFWQCAEEALEKFNYDLDDEAANGTTAELRDRFRQVFEQVLDCEFISASECF